MSASVAFTSVLAYISFSLEVPISKIMSYFRCGSAICARGLAFCYTCHQFVVITKQSLNALGTFLFSALGLWAGSRADLGMPGCADGEAAGYFRWPLRVSSSSLILVCFMYLEKEKKNGLT